VITLSMKGDTKLFYNWKFYDKIAEATWPSFLGPVVKCLNVHFN
jgi:hypothetical protein